MDINIVLSVIIAILGSAGLWKVVEVVAQRGLKNQQNIYTESTSIRKELRDEVATLKQQADELNDKLNTSSRENLQLQAEIHALRLENAEFRKENQELREEVAGLRALLEKRLKDDSRRTRTKRESATDSGQ